MKPSQFYGGSDKEAKDGASTFKALEKAGLTAVSINGILYYSLDDYSKGITAQERIEKDKRKASP